MKPLLEFAAAVLGSVVLFIFVTAWLRQRFFATRSDPWSPPGQHVRRKHPPDRRH